MSVPMLLLEAGEALGIRGEPVGQNLDGHVAPQAGVLGQVHQTLTAAAQLLDDPVRTDLLG